MHIDSVDSQLCQCDDYLEGKLHIDTHAHIWLKYMVVYDEHLHLINLCFSIISGNLIYIFMVNAV